MASPTAVIQRLAGQISAIPSNARTSIRGGFAIALSLSQEKQEQVLGLLLSKIEKGAASFDLDAVKRETGVENLVPGEIRQLLSALTTTVGLLTDTEVSADEFVEAAKEQLFAAADAGAAKLVADLVIKQRAELSQAMGRRYLEAAVLPSLTRFDVAVDLRFKFTDDKIENAAPVVVAYFGTDGEGQDLWIQLSRTDVEMLERRFARLLKQLDAAEAVWKTGGGQQ